MRVVHGLGFTLVLIPARVFSLSFRPLLNAALYLLKDKSSYLAPVKHIVVKSCNYHCENKCDDWNGHRGEVLMMYNSQIILGTKQRLIDSLLDDRMSVWAMTFPTIHGLLVLIWGQCSMSRGATETVANRIDEIQIPQQHLSKLDIRAYTLGRFACVKLISMLHKSRNLGFHLSAESYVDAAFQGLHIKLRKRHPGDPVMGDGSMSVYLQAAWGSSPSASVALAYHP
jgi:hypothetical protein